jgi:hypothetical protein
VLDNAGWHGPEGLAVPEGISLVFLPPYSPELQPAERLWPLVDEPIVNRHFASLARARRHHRRALPPPRRSHHQAAHRVPLVAQTQETELIIRISYQTDARRAWLLSRPLVGRPSVEARACGFAIRALGSLPRRRIQVRKLANTPQPEERLRKGSSPYR